MMCANQSDFVHSSQGKINQMEKMKITQIALHCFMIFTNLAFKDDLLKARQK